jgi:hypothetical protein
VGQARREEGPARYINLALHLHTATNTPTTKRAQQQHQQPQATIEPPASMKLFVVLLAVAAAASALPTQENEPQGPQGETHPLSSCPPTKKVHAFLWIYFAYGFLITQLYNSIKL